MTSKYALSLVLNADFPFVPGRISRLEHSLRLQNARLERARAKNADSEASVPESIVPQSAEESLFFDAVCETYLPLLEVMDRLEADRVPFRFSLAVSPLMAQMLCDEDLMKKCAAHFDRRIAFGAEEMQRGGSTAALAKRYMDEAVERRAAFTARYDGNILAAINHYRRRERIEILASPATGAFLPFLCGFPESFQAQVEVGLSFCRQSLGTSPQGFWLPALGWSPSVEPFIKAYGFGFTIADSSAFAAGSPPPSGETFFPVRTPQGLFVLGRDSGAVADIAGIKADRIYRDNGRDAGHELQADAVAAFIAANGARCRTGYKYWASGNGGVPYDPAAAEAGAVKHAGLFLENRRRQLSGVASVQEQPISLCALDADAFGLDWYEGPRFLESLFRLAASSRDTAFVSLSDYLCRRPFAGFEVSVPEFTSWGEGGYAEAWLDSPNDWIYRHLSRCCAGMVELVERFSGGSWVRERALNQAARELLLAQSSYWPQMMRRRESSDFARRGIEDALRNFGEIYDAMLSNRVSTEWLTDIENRRGIFPDINYGVFRRRH